VSADRHRYTLGNARADHVPDGRSAEVVENSARVPRISVAFFAPVTVHSLAAEVTDDSAQTSHNTGRSP
jgi:hypothetical protein